MIFGSVCSGIEAATEAWKPLGWEAAWYSEIEKFPSAVLAHRHPETPNYGDMTKFKEWPDATLDLLVGGTPCQSFSVAGLRKGLDDPRGNLMLTYCAIADRYRPRWLVWENVPGVLSSNGGRDFGTFLGMLGQLGYGVAYRVLDAQYFGVPQRRRRVFVVGYLGDWRRAAAVLFERHSLQGHSAPRREAGPAVAALTANGVGTCGADDNQGQAGHLVAGTLTATYAEQSGQDLMDMKHGLQVAHVETMQTMRAGASNGGSGHGARSGDTKDEYIVPVVTSQYGDVAGSLTARHDSSPCADRGQNVVAFAENSRAEVRLEGGDGQRCGALSTGGGKPGQGTPMIITQAVNIRGRDGGATAEISGEVATALRASQGGGDKLHCLTEMAVRRLTPVECERLQGFGDNYTRIPWRGKNDEACPDGPRYKALGNSMAVPVMGWIGERIEQVESLGYT